MYIYLIDKISTDLKVPRCTIKTILDRFRDELVNCICENGVVIIPKWGSYTLKQTKRSIRIYGRLIKPYFYIKFKPSNEMKRRLLIKSKKELNYEFKKYEGELGIQSR